MPNIVMEEFELHHAFILKGKGGLLRDLAAAVESIFCKLLSQKE